MALQMLMLPLYIVSVCCIDMLQMTQESMLACPVGYLCESSHSNKATEQQTPFVRTSHVP
jgi:hypothetical protein